MKLQHYLGGLENLGPIEFQKRVFVQPWEERIFGIHVAMMGLSNHLKETLPKYPIDQVPTTFKDYWTWAHLRTGAEGMNPFDYFKYRYYEKWLGGISGYFVEKGYITQDQLESRTAVYLADGNMDDAPLPVGGDVAIDNQIIKYLEEGDSPKRDLPEAPLFGVGDSVLIKNVPAEAHTRVPGHLRGKKGVVSEVYEGAFTYFVDTGPDGIGTPMPVYAVSFDPADIWGETMSDPNSTVYADLFQSYLEAA